MAFLIRWAFSLLRLSSPQSSEALSRQDVVTEVARRLEYRDVARCCSVSKVWNSCCKLELDKRHRTLQGYLLGESAIYRLPQGKRVVEWLNPPQENRPYRVVGSFQDVVVIQTVHSKVEPKCYFLVGSPDRFPGRWKKIPDPCQDLCDTWEMSIGLSSDGELLLYRQRRGQNVIYSSRRDCWTYSPYVQAGGPTINWPVWLRGAVYLIVMGLIPNPEIDNMIERYGLIKYDVEEAKWSKMELSEEDREKLGGIYSKYLVVLLGKLFVFGVHYDDYESVDSPVVYKVYQVENKEGLNYKLVDVTSSYAKLLDAAKADQAFAFYGCPGDDNHVVYWTTSWENWSEHRVGAYSVVQDECIASFPSVRGSMGQTFYHTGATGDAFTHFKSLPWLS